MDAASDAIPMYSTRCAPCAHGIVGLHSLRLYAIGICRVLRLVRSWLRLAEGAERVELEADITRQLFCQYIFDIVEIAE